jgi:DNA-binding GntR family transcriptional regulator
MSATTKTVRIQRQSLASAVANILREKILRGEVKAGEQLRQHVIASELEVSRIPVREALRQLEAEGLVTIVHDHGAVVTSLSPEDVVEMFEIRMVLESYLLREAIPRLTESDLRHAEGVLHAYESSLNQDSDVAAWGQLNWEFHSTLYAAANRPKFLAIAQNIHHNADRYVRLHLVLVHDIAQANNEHREILELCKQGNVDSACGLLEKHIISSGRQLADYLSRHHD